MVEVFPVHQAVLVDYPVGFHYGQRGVVHDGEDSHLSNRYKMFPEAYHKKHFRPRNAFLKAFSMEFSERERCWLLPTYAFFSRQELLLVAEGKIELQIAEQ